MNGFRGSTLAMMLVAGALSAPTIAAQPDRHTHGEADAGTAHLGTVVFPTSANARAQASFVRGIALLHSFHYEEAAKAFQAAEHADTAFALPYWFEAFTHSHMLWGEDDPAAARGVLTRLAPTPDGRLARAATPRERAYGAAIESFYMDTTPPVRARAFADSMRGVATRYPDDAEAAVFSALATMIALDLDAFPRDESRARSADMVDRAEHVFATNPNHPGAAHYLIHVSDLDPSFTTRALPAARAYARIAPDASHALHMPSHVFVRLGMWDDVAASNVRSWNASRREMRRDHASGADLDSHSLLFLSYAYLESGRWRAARALIDSARRVIGDADVSGAMHVDGRYAVSDLAFLYALDTDRWADAVLPPAADGPAKNPREAFFALTADYARSVIQAKRGDTAALVRDAAVFRAGADSGGFRAPIKSYIASELEGMLAEARGDPSRAIEKFARAGRGEDGAPVVGPPRFVIAREQLGAVYLRTGQPDSAAAQFERVLVNTPNRSAALLGLARARLAAGDSSAAAAAYTRLAANWRHADADLPALAEVRAGASRRFMRVEARHRDTVAYFDAAGVRLRYFEQGAVEPVVLVHGYGNTAEIWAANGIVQDLSRNYRVIAFDMRGHGKSDKPHEPAKYGREMTLDIVRLLDHLRIQRAHIVGYSLGGHLVSHLLTLRPERFLSAALVAGAGRFDWNAERARQAEVVGAERERECISRSLLFRLAPPNAARPSEDSLKALSAKCFADSTQDRFALAAVIRSNAEQAITPAATAAVTVPTLGIVGSNDPEKAELEALVRIRPTVKLVVIDGATHAGPGGILGRPELLAALRTFLSDHRAK